jgi:hypothetical protein
MTTDHRSPVTQWRRLPVVALALTVLLAVLLIAFTWPTVRTKPHQVPIAVVGPAPAVTAFVNRVPGDAFDITRVADTAAARDLIDDEDAYGAFILGPTPRLLTASAASPMVAQTLIALAPPGTTVHDVKPLPVDDPRGSGLANSVMPLVFASIAAAVVLTAAVRSRAQRVATAIGFAVIAGFLIVAILRF